MFREGAQIGLYTPIRKLGRGGFGEVWLAEKHSHFITKKVAVKLPHDDQVNLDAISQEATLWEAASGHPNVLPIIDADIYDGQVAIVSEYADGGSLGDKLKTSGKISVKQAVEITIGILNGLQYLHSKNIIHRDIKPANILLQGDMPRLADFGISRAMNTSNISSVIIGTEAYMAPESFSGKRNIQTDIWSVGVVLYQMLNGSLPFPQEHPSERMFAILTREFEPLNDDLPLKLQEIVKKSLDKISEQRYQTASEMRDDLQNFVSGVLQSALISDRSIVTTFSDNEELETKLRTAPPFAADDTAILIDTNDIPPTQKQEEWGYKVTDRARGEETGLSTEAPVRGNRESDTYWNTRTLTHSILAEHYRTPQYNMKSLRDFLNSKLPEDKKIIRFSFVVTTSSNLRFFTNNQEISFDAHQPINKNDFLKAFGLKDSQKIIPIQEGAEYQQQIKENEQNDPKGLAGKYPRYYKFWERLLALGKTKSDIHDNVKPRHNDGICIKNVRGLKFHYVVNQNDGRIEFYIDTGEVWQNKRIYDELIKYKDEIDAVFGDSLSWERLDHRKSSRLGYYFKGGVNSNESEWTALHTKMIDAMIRLEKAVSPFIPRLAQIYK